MRLSTLLGKIIHLGVHEKQDTFRKNKLMIFNLDLLLCTTMLLVVLLFINLYSNDGTASDLNGHLLVFTLICSTCFYLNTRVDYELSSFVHSTGSLAVIMAFVVNYGIESHIYYTLCYIAFQPLMYYQQYLKSAIAFLVLTALIYLYCATVDLFFEAPPPTVHTQLLQSIVTMHLYPTVVYKIVLFSIAYIRIQQELSEEQQKVAAQHQYLRNIIDLNPNFIFAKDKYGAFTLANKAVAAAYATTTSAIIGKTDADFNPHATEVEQFRANDMKVLEKDDITFIPMECITDALGNIKYLQTVKMPLLDANGKLTQILGVSTDITARVAAEKALEEKNKQLQKYIDSNMQLENFAYMASHDLKEPLRTIISFTQLLQRQYANQFDERGRTYLAYIVKGTKNLDALITDLLAYSRVNTKALQITRFDLPQMLNNLIHSIQPHIADNKATVSIGKTPNFIKGDAIRLQQLLQNLVLNGIKFQKANELPKVHISCEETATHWQFMVRDNGIGIHPEYHDKIFLLFRRLHTKKQYQGTGIGLAICKKVVEQHCGSIWVDSAMGEGATFYFTLKKNYTLTTDETIRIHEPLCPPQKI